MEGIEHDPYAEELARHLQHDHGCGHLVQAVARWAAGRSTLSGVAVNGGEIVREHLLDIEVMHTEHHREPDGEGGSRVIDQVRLHAPMIGPEIEGTFSDGA